MTGKVSEQETASRRPGRPEHKPSDDQRALVKQLKGEGKKVPAIAAALGLAPGTLRKYYVTELGGGPEVEVEAKPPELDFGQAAHTPDKVSGTVRPAHQGGRPAFEFSDRDRETVKLCKADGWTHDEIALYFGISRNTLTEHFAKELAAGVREKRVLMLRQLWVEVLAGSISAFDRFSRLKGMVAPGDLTTEDLIDLETADDDTTGLGKKELANRAALKPPPKDSPWAAVAPTFKH